MSCVKNFSDVQTVSMGDLTALVKKRPQGHVVRVAKKKTGLAVTEIPQEVFQEMKKRESEREGGHKTYICMETENEGCCVVISLTSPCSIIFPMSQNESGGYAHDCRLAVEKQGAKIVVTVARHRYYAPREAVQQSVSI